MDFEELLEQTILEREPEKIFTIGEKIIEQSESEFKSYSEEEKSRRQEEEELKKKRQKLYLQLGRCKNIKNHRMKAQNAERATKRTELRRKIGECDLRLQEISQER